MIGRTLGLMGAAVTLVCVGSGEVVAQQDDTIGGLVGQRVHVTPCDGAATISGTVVRADSTQLRLSLDATRVVDVPLARLRTVEIRTRDRALWAQIGLFGGAIAAAVGYYFWHNMRYANGEYASLTAVFIAAPIGALIGAPVAALAAPEQRRLFHSPHIDCES